MPAILGIDPGLKGGLALYQPSQLVVWAMPTVKVMRNGSERGETDMQQLLALFRIAKREGATAVVEKVGARRGEAASSAFTFGKGYGAILMGLAACEVPVEHVAPQTWKKAMATPADKGMARARASEVFPSHANLWPLKKDDGKAEAALMAEYLRRKLQAF